jgi:hypothetical protein
MGYGKDASDRRVACDVPHSASPHPFSSKPGRALAELEKGQHNRSQGFMRLSKLLPFVVIVAICACPAAHALDRDAPAFFIYRGQGVDSDLLQMPEYLITGDLIFEPSYLTALGFIWPLRTPGPIQAMFDGFRVPDTRTGVETIVVKHDGLQDNWEADLAYMLRFRGWEAGGLTVRPGFAIGLSYAFGTPSYEDGPKGDPERRYRFQSFQAYEFEWGLKDHGRAALITGVHHRSGMYGLIAPRRVGSNFVTLGVRISL